MLGVFISYASPDRAFALRLAVGLEELGHKVWIDLREIRIGDSTIGTIARGIDQAECIIVVLSKNTQLSSWVEREWHIKYFEEITHGQLKVLPVIIEDCTIPPFLRAKRFADFRLNFEMGFLELVGTLQSMDQQHPTFPESGNGYIALSDQRSNLFEYNSSYMLGQNHRLVEVAVEIGVPYVGKVTGVWRPDEREQSAAWELYVELVTRITVAGLQDDEGLLREGLTSLYAIFNITRDILRKYGPAIARPKAKGDISFGYLAVHILNFAIRPVLAKWHPLLLDYEYTKPQAISAFEHERQWEKASKLRQALSDTRLTLIDYTNILAQVAGIPRLNGS